MYLLDIEQWGQTTVKMNDGYSNKWVTTDKNDAYVTLYLIMGHTNGEIRPFSITYPTDSTSVIFQAFDDSGIRNITTGLENHNATGFKPWIYMLATHTSFLNSNVPIEYISIGY